MPDNENRPFYQGNVRMVAQNEQFTRPVEVKEFDHSTNQGRLAVRDFVHRHLCAGNVVSSIPIPSI